MIDSFRNLPISSLVQEPLVAAASGQQALVMTYIKFLETTISKNREGDNKPKTLKMNIERYLVDQKTGKTSKINSKIEAPILGLVPTPALFVKSVDIDFSVEVKAATTEKESSSSSTTAEASVGGGFFGISLGAKMSGSLASQKENTRSTDHSAKYAFKIRAEQANPPETLSRLLDLLNQTIEPIPINN